MGRKITRADKAEGRGKATMGAGSDSGEEKRAEMRALIAHLRGAAGVGHGAPGLETFLLMPDDFRRAYDRLVDRALKPAVNDSGGQATAEAARLGKRKDDNSLKGKRIGMGGGVGKRWKVFWTVRDERALELKSRVDRQLRKLAREIARAEAEWDSWADEGPVGDSEAE